MAWRVVVVVASALCAGLIGSSSALQLSVSDDPLSFLLPENPSTIVVQAQLTNCSADVPLVSLCILPILPPPRNGWLDSCALILPFVNCVASGEIGLPSGEVWMALDWEGFADVALTWSICNGSSAGPGCSRNVSSLVDLECNHNDTDTSLSFAATLQLPEGEAYYRIALTSDLLLPAQLNMSLSLLAPISSVAVFVRPAYLPSAAQSTAHITLFDSALISLPTPPLGSLFVLFNSSASLSLSLLLSVTFCRPGLAGPTCNITLEELPSHHSFFTADATTLWPLDPRSVHRLSLALYRNASAVPLPTLELLQGNVPSDVFASARIASSPLYPVSFLLLPSLPTSARYFIRVSDFAAEDMRVALWLNDVCPGKCHAPYGKCTATGDLQGLCDCNSTAVLSLFDCAGALPREAESAILIVLLSVTCFAVVLGLGHYLYRRHKLLTTGYATLH